MEEIRAAAAAAQGDAVEFLRDLIRIPSFSGQEAEVIGAIRRKMSAVGFDEVRVDPFGNVLGRIGSGPRVLAFDAHVDTVGVGDPKSWSVDPFGADVAGGVIYGRGASDQKGGMASLVYAGSIIKRLGIGDAVTVWIVGSVLEEDCDGLCWHYILNEKVLEPEIVVLTEPTELQVYRGQRGRMEIELTTRGVSAHGSAPERGVNAVYRMAPVIGEIERLNDRLGDDPFLGPGSVTISEIRSTSPSMCAVADSSTIHLDRRLTAGETDRSALGEIDQLLGGEADRVEVRVSEFDRPSHTGLVYPMRQYFPAWVLPESHEAVVLGLRARKAIMGEGGAPGRWTFSTNGVATMGLHGVPTIGFGPASERHAHAPSDQCPVRDIETAIAFYAAFASLFASEA